MLEYRIFGGPRVLENGHELHVGGHRQRRLLAVLLLYRDETVSTDRAIEAVFAGNPTRRAGATLRTYVMRLRRVLEGDGRPPVVTTEQAGYRLRAGPDAVDASRFEVLAAEGRTLLEKNAPGRAAVVLTKGLELWSGEPYAEFANEPWVLPESQRLRELRSRLEEDLVSAELDNGRTVEVVARLDAMIQRNPLRESPRAQLMLALYRSGRQADALRVMRDYRQLLAEATGLDPSPELERLEHRILVHDTGLGEPSGAERVVRGYRLGERLGSGRDGTVHAARLPGVHRDLVIKVIAPAIADRPDVVRSFDATMRRVAALHHPAIVPIDDHWREPGRAYVVLRRMRGGTLRDRLSDGGLHLGEVGELARRIGAALGAAHEAGVAHGRVIPESVLFDDDDLPYLSDFPLGEVDASPGEDVAALSALLRAAISANTTLSSTARSDLLRRVGPADLADTAELASLLERVERLVGTGTPDGTTSNPFKGLRAFEEADQADFFGRDQLVDELVQRLCTRGVAGRFVLVVGASGSGKSSLIRAGVLPVVRAGAVPGSDKWLITTMTPGPEPFQELAESLNKVAVVASHGDGPRKLVTARALRQRGLEATLQQVVPDDSKLLLVVDQFEELFSLAGEHVQRAFMQQLAAALTSADSKVRVIAALRADHYDRPLSFRGFGELVRDATVTVTAMSAAQLEATITGPADRVGLEVDPALVAEVVAAVVDQPAAMPSLQFILFELAHDGRGRLDLAAYRQLGGIGGAIAARAEQLYGSLDDGEGVVRQVFEHLVVIGPEGEPTRRTVSVSELYQILSVDDLDEVIEPWVEARLLQRDRHAKTREPTIEVAHEALLREWPRLRNWIEEGRAAIVAADELRAAARSWEAHDRDAGALHRGAKLETTLARLRGRTHALPASSKAFLDASVSARDHRRAAKEALAAQQARTNRRLRQLAGASVVATLVAMVGGIVALDQRQQAFVDRQLAEARELAAASTAVVEEDAQLAILLALEGLERSRAGGREVLPAAEVALHRAVTESRVALDVQEIGGSVAWHPDGTKFVTEGPEESGLVDIRDARTGDAVLTWTGHETDINDVTFNDDGSLVATAGDDGLVRVWASDSGELRTEVAGIGDVWGVTFSPDGSRLAAGWRSEQIVRIIDVETAAAPVELDIPTTESTDSLSFGPDGERVAAASLGGVLVVDIASGEELLRFDRSRARAFSVSWSPDGRWIASTSDGTAPRIIDATTGALLAELTEERAPVYALDWSADSSLLATGALDGTARVYELPRELSGSLSEAPVERVSLASRAGGVWSLAFGGTGDDLLLTGDSVATTTRIWNVSTGGGAEWANVPIATGLPLTAASFTPDGRTVATSGEDEAAVVWDAATGARRTTVGAGRPAAVSVAVSPDGELLATTDVGSAVSVWDSRSGDQRYALRVPSLLPDNVAWSPDGALLAVTGEDRLGVGRVSVFDRNGTLVTVFEDDEHDRTSFDVSFADNGQWIVSTRTQFSRTNPAVAAVRVRSWPDGDVLADLPVFPSAIAAQPTGPVVATADFDGSVELWDPRSSQRLASLEGHTGRVADIAFSADGRRVATAGLDGTVRVWATETGIEQLVLDSHDGPVDSVSFSPQGDRLVSTGGGVARVWALDIDDLITIAEARLIRSLTAAECQRYLHTESCPR